MDVIDVTETTTQEVRHTVALRRKNTATSWMKAITRIKGIMGLKWSYSTEVPMDLRKGDE